MAENSEDKSSSMKVKPKKMRLWDKSKDNGDSPPKPSVQENAFRDKMLGLVEIFEDEMKTDSRKKCLQAIFQVICLFKFDKVIFLMTA